MCGIAALFSKSQAIEEELGDHLVEMLGCLTERGPDGAGVALYRRPAPRGACKLSLFADNQAYDWEGLARGLADEFGGAIDLEIRAKHAVVVTATDPVIARAWLAKSHPEVQLMGCGPTIEIFKGEGSPSSFLEHLGLRGTRASHAIGHTRLATESQVTAEHAQPFSTPLDLCLVHNGSLCNHHNLRRELVARGVGLQTGNDSEVAAGYLAWRMQQGATLSEALEDCLAALDGSYSFVVGVASGFAVLCDPIGSKPVVVAETECWVAIASEYRAISVLPGVGEARLWEPEPGRVYRWERGPVGCGSCR